MPNVGTFNNDDIQGEKFHWLPDLLCPAASSVGPIECIFLGSSAVCARVLVLLSKTK